MMESARSTAASLHNSSSKGTPSGLRPPWSPIDPTVLFVIAGCQPFKAVVSARQRTPPLSGPRSAEGRPHAGHLRRGGKTTRHASLPDAGQLVVRRLLQGRGGDQYAGSAGPSPRRTAGRLPREQAVGHRLHGETSVRDLAERGRTAGPPRADQHRGLHNYCAHGRARAWRPCSERVTTTAAPEYGRDGRPEADERTDFLEVWNLVLCRNQ